MKLCILQPLPLYRGLGTWEKELSVNWGWRVEGYGNWRHVRFRLAVVPKQCSLRNVSHKALIPLYTTEKEMGRDVSLYRESNQRHRKASEPMWYAPQVPPHHFNHLFSPVCLKCKTESLTHYLWSCWKRPGATLANKDNSSTGIAGWNRILVEKEGEERWKMLPISGELCERNRYRWPWRLA